MDNTQLGIIIGAIIALIGGVAGFVRSLFNRTLTSHEKQTDRLVGAIDRNSDKADDTIHELRLTRSEVGRLVSSLTPPPTPRERADPTPTTAPIRRPLAAVRDDHDNER